MKCCYCIELCVKAGLQRNGIQKYYCKACRKYQQSVYKFRNTRTEKQQQLVRLYREGVGIRGLGRLLNISPSTAQRYIVQIVQTIQPPPENATDQVYEVDELWTYVGSKQHEVWITYAMNRSTRQVVNFCVGNRTLEILSNVVKPLLTYKPKRICTDGLNSYRSLVPKAIHTVGLPHTRHIERNNLTLRSRLKRLQRKTIGFSRSVTHA